MARDLRPTTCCLLVSSPSWDSFCHTFFGSGAYKRSRVVLCNNRSEPSWDEAPRLDHHGEPLSVEQSHLRFVKALGPARYLAFLVSYQGRAYCLGFARTISYTNCSWYHIITSSNHSNEQRWANSTDPDHNWLGTDGADMYGLMCELTSR